MKKQVFLFFLMVFCALGLSAQVADNALQQTNPNAPKAKFDKTVFDFGEIKQNIPREALFLLTNHGNEPLIISQAKASCGCTSPKYSQEPVLPGKTTSIAVTYNAAAPGQFSKTITVITNADPNPVVLVVKGTVIQ